MPRRISAWVLVVLACILIPVSVISVWAIRTVTNTDQYVETMAPLARNPVIVQGLATKATDALFSTNLVKDKVTAALPKSAKPLVAPVVGEVKTYVHSLALKVFESPKFGQLWDSLNRHSHDAVINVLTGKQTPLQEKLSKGGKVALNLSPALNNLIDQANAHGVTLFNPIKTLSNQGLSFTVVSKQQVSKFSGLFNLIVKLKWVIPVVALVLAILALVLAVERRKTLLRLSVGVALMTLVLLVGYSLGRITFLNQAVSGGFKTQGAAAVFDTVLRYLKADLRWTLLASVVVALGAWVAGPARYAVWIRGTSGGCPLGRRTGARAVLGCRAGGRRIEPGAPLCGLDPRAHQRIAHRRGRRGGALLGLRRKPDGVEPACHCDRAGRVSRAPAARGDVGTEGVRVGSRARARVRAWVGAWRRIRVRRRHQRPRVLGYRLVTPHREWDLCLWSRPFGAPTLNGWPKS